MSAAVRRLAAWRRVLKERNQVGVLAWRCGHCRWIIADDVIVRLSVRMNLNSRLSVQAALVVKVEFQALALGGSLDR